MPKIAGLRVPSVAAQQVATIDQLMAQNQKLKAEVARLEAAIQCAIDNAPPGDAKSILQQALDGRQFYKEIMALANHSYAQAESARAWAKAWKWAAKEHYLFGRAWRRIEPRHKLECK